MKPKILYIDDEMNSLTSFNACFREHFQIFTAVSAEEGLTILKEQSSSKNALKNIQVIISDQKMPVMTGSVFFASIIENYPNPIRILLTGYSDMSDLVDAVNKGKIYSYHSKPFKNEELLEDLLKACNLYQLQSKKTELTKNLKDVNQQLEFMIRQKLLS